MNGFFLFAVQMFSALTGHDFILEIWLQIEYLCMIDLMSMSRSHTRLSYSINISIQHNEVIQMIKYTFIIHKTYPGAIRDRIIQLINFKFNEVMKHFCKYEHIIIIFKIYIGYMSFYDSQLNTRSGEIQL